MPDLKTHIQDFFQKYRSSELIIACSGGIDSMVLLSLAKEFHPNIHVAHMNYQLRGEDSEKDEQHVREFCQQHDLKLSVRKVDLIKILDKDKGNLQDLARKKRYDFFNELAGEKNSVVALGQHLDDQIETFFLNLARGGGIAGLSSIHPEKGKFLRPLLPFSREEITDFALKNNIAWREDLSNSDSKYNRNKLRNIILPELYNEIPSLKENVILLVEKFRQTQKELERELKPLVNEIRKNMQLPLSAYDKLNDFQKVELLRQLNIPVSHLEEFKKLRLAEKGRFTEINNSEIFKIIRENDHFFFDQIETTTPAVGLVKQVVDSLPKTFTKDEIYLDPEKIKGELQIRKWKIGDRISPIGLKGSKLISDVLTDAKTPNHNRKNILVVCDNEKILWCPGYSVSRLAIARSDSKKLKLSLTFD